MDSRSIEERPLSDSEFDSTPDQLAPRQRGSAWLAWMAIIVTIVFMMMPHSFVEKNGDSELSTALFEIQAKYLVGASRLGVTSEETNAEQIQMMFGRGPLRQQLIGVTLTSELVGPKAAAQALNDLSTEIENDKLKSTANEREIVDLFQKIELGRIDGKDVDKSLTESEIAKCRELFPELMGWAGRLALLPAESLDQATRTTVMNQARRTFFVIIGALLLGIVATVCGLVLQLLWWVFLALGRLTSEIGEIHGSGAIYAETFAVWMVLFIVLSIIISSSPLPKLGFVMVLIPQIGGLGALAWPVFRGLKWNDVCQDIGLWMGPRAWTSPFLGVAAYLSALPIVGVAMVVTLVMMAVASQFAGADDGIGSPAHPIVEHVLRGSWSTKLQLMFVAVFAAVPEEIMFRGVLYRHLRESKSKLGYFCGVAFAMLFSSFVFAAIHPQGLFGIPILMSLAMVFAIVREWRGSLVPCMIAHALVNAGTTTILLAISD